VHHRARTNVVHDLLPSVASISASGAFELTPTDPSGKIEFYNHANKLFFSAASPPRLAGRISAEVGASEAAAFIFRVTGEATEPH
jgi:hypothetical protein